MAAVEVTVAKQSSARDDTDEERAGDGPSFASRVSSRIRLPAIGSARPRRTRLRPTSEPPPIGQHPPHSLSMRVTAHGLEANDPIVTVTPSSPPPRPADWAIGTQTPPRRVVGGRPFHVAARRHSAATKAALCSRLCHDRGLLRAQPADRGLARARCRACRFAPAPRAGARWFRRQDAETMTMHAAIYARDTLSG